MSELKTPDEPLQLISHTSLSPKNHANIGAIIRKMLTGELDASTPPNLGQFNGHGAMIEQLFDVYTHGGPARVLGMLPPLIKGDPELGYLIFGQTDEPMTTPTSERKFYTIAEYIMRPPVKHLDKAKTIQERGITVAFGKPSGGKSLWMLHTALEIAEQRDVLLVFAEGQAGMSDRFRAEQILRKTELSSRVRITDDNVDLVKLPDVQRFITQVKAQGLSPDLIVFDTLAACMPGADENAGPPMTTMIEHCKLIIRELGCAILLLHHTTKDGDEYRGHSSLHGGADIMLRIKQTKKGVITVSGYKAKDGPLLESLSFQLQIVITRQDPDTGENVTGAALLPLESPEEPTAENCETLNPDQRKVLEVLQTAGTPLERKEILAAAEMKAGGTWLDTIKSLLEAGYVYQEADRKPYCITEAGQALLANQAE